MLCASARLAEPSSENTTYATALSLSSSRLPVSTLARRGIFAALPSPWATLTARRRTDSTAPYAESSRARALRLHRAERLPTKTVRASLEAPL
eukprot:CAMPEP_0183798926 /NCGR_PEP_ID=MMETSP0803_2-20130417/20183_1 /TAXON_ID=195967 /ORGANISM="Crustomastix stigmata, Strain CCMP3273" /LENGTH=92 /DNA_ID=CAMNT_0026043623 /DNA_START=9 /DNA_END=284 /DNA_ORIENTATION=+